MIRVVFTFLLVAIVSGIPAQEKYSYEFHFRDSILIAHPGDGSYIHQLQYSDSTVFVLYGPKPAIGRYDLRSGTLKVDSLQVDQKFQVYSINRSKDGFLVFDVWSKRVLETDLDFRTVRCHVLKPKHKGLWIGIGANNQKSPLLVAEDRIVFLCSGGIPRDAETAQKKFYSNAQTLVEYDRKGRVKKLAGHYSPQFTEQVDLKWARKQYGIYSATQSKFYNGALVDPTIYVYSSDLNELTEMAPPKEMFENLPLRSVGTNVEHLSLGFQPLLESYNFMEIVEDIPRGLIARLYLEPTIDSTSPDPEYEALLRSENEDYSCLAPNPRLKQQSQVHFLREWKLLLFDSESVTFKTRLNTGISAQYTYMGSDSNGNHAFGRNLGENYVLKFYTLSAE